MKQCEEYTMRIDLYLDDELEGEELSSFKDHIKSCPECRDRLWSRRLYLERIRSSRPLYTAPLALRDRIERLLEQEEDDSGPVHVYREQTVAAADKAPSRTFFPWFKPVPAFATFGLAVAGLLLLWTFSEREARANAFVDMAVQTHQQQVSGHIPVEVATNSPAEMTDWFSKRVPFPFRLPTYREEPGQSSPYRLVGGRLVRFRGDSAAYIAYEMNNTLISLLITSGPNSLASGGETTTTKGLTFHSHQRDGLQVVTWSVHKLSYALVSSITLPAGRSCVVCHAQPRDSELLRSMH